MLAMPSNKLNSLFGSVPPSLKILFAGGAATPLLDRCQLGMKDTNRICLGQVRCICGHGRWLIAELLRCHGLGDGEWLRLGSRNGYVSVVPGPPWSFESHPSQTILIGPHLFPII